MSIVIISFTCCFLQIYDDFYGPFFNDISGGILNDYLHAGKVPHEVIPIIAEFLHFCVEVFGS